MDSSGLPIPTGTSEPLSTVLHQLNSQGMRLSGAPLPPQTRATSSYPPGAEHMIGTPNAAPSRENFNPITDFSASQFLQRQGINTWPDSNLVPFVNASGNQVPVSFHAPFGTTNTGLSGHGQNIQIHDTSKSQAFIAQPGGSGVPNAQVPQNQSTVRLNDYQMLLNYARTAQNRNDRPFISRNVQNPGSSSAIPKHLEQRWPNWRGQHQKQEESTIPVLSPMAARACRNVVPKVEKRPTSPVIRPLVEEEQTDKGKQPIAEEQVLPKKRGVDLAYTRGRGAERLKEYLLQQRNRPQDNNIQFWRNFVAEFFVPNAKKRWCVSQYKTRRQTEGIFSKALWQCELCNEKPCRGFEICGEVLPRLHKMKYDIGMLDERFRVDKPCEYQCASGQIFLHYPQAIEEADYKQLRIVRAGQLRIIFSSDLKIVTWEFCAKLHEECIQRRLLPQACQVGAAFQNYQYKTTQLGVSSSSAPPEDLQRNIDEFVSSGNQMVDTLERPVISQIGIAKQYMRYLQISEVLNIMNDLVEYSVKKRIAPRESMARFPQFGSNPSSVQSEPQRAPVASPAPYFPHFVGTGNESGFSASPAFAEPNNQKRQRISPNNPYAQTLVQPRLSIPVAGPWSIFPEFTIPTPFPNAQPQVAYTEIAREPHHQISALSAQQAWQYNVAGPSSSTPHGVEVIDVENYVCRNEGTRFSAPMTSGLGPSSQMNMDVIPQGATGSNVPMDIDDYLFNQLLDIGALHELLNS